MKIPKLDPKTREAISKLTLKEVSRKVSYAYEHELKWYGIDALAHVYLMNQAKDVSNGKLSKEEFIQKYRLDFSGYKYTDLVHEGKFSVPLKNIELDGIFIPEHANWYEDGKRRDRIVLLFDDDYGNRVMRDTWSDKKYAEQLIYNQKWEPSDLENIELVQQGIKFGKDMWLTCVTGFDEYSKNYPQPKKVTTLGKKLIDYYSKIIESC